MSTDPNSGIAFVTMFDDSGGKLSKGAQFSGVLIAPDEILTVAHGVVASDGTILDTGTAYLGYDGGPLTGGDAITAVHVLDTTHRLGGVETDSLVASDFAVVRLATPVTSAATFSLGTGAPGTYTITGYPAVARGARTSVTEGLRNGYASGELTGGEILPGLDGAGASGSPVFATAGDVSTVRGLYTADDGAGHAMLTSLTQADVDQIKAWVYADDKGDSWGAAFAPTSPGSQPGSTTPPPPLPAPVDRLDRLATSLRTASASEAAPKALMSNDVATALQMAVGRGLTGEDLPDAAYGAAAILRRTSWTPRKSIAYVAGLFAGESGVARGGVLGYVANVFGLSVLKTLDRVVMAGYADDAGLGSTVTSAPIASTAPGDGWTARDLGAALGQPGLADMTSGTTAVHDPADAGRVLLKVDQGAIRHMV